MEQPQSTNSDLQESIAAPIRFSAKSIQDFNWKMSQVYWVCAVEDKFKRHTDLMQEVVNQKLLLFGGLKQSVGPMLETCEFCADYIETNEYVPFGTDEVSEAIMALCQNTSNRAELFVYLAVNYYNGMRATEGNPDAMKLITRSYHAIANYCNKHGRIPTTNMPSGSNGCLIPFAILASGLLAVVAVIVRLV